MKSTIPKPILRAAAASTSAATNNPQSYPPALLSKRFPLSSPTASASSSHSRSTTALARTHTAPVPFLRRNFSSHTFSPFMNSRSFIPLGTLAILGSAMLFFGSSAVGAISFSAFSNKPNGATRMRERLTKHGFIEKSIAPDGNCQMRALSDQILGDENFHKDVRLKIMQWLSTHEKYPIDDDGGSVLGDFIDRDQFPKWTSYVTHMSQNGIWGDHITLLAAAETYGVTINILSNVDDNGTGQYVTRITPRSTKSTKEINLSHWHEAHYNSLYPANPDNHSRAEAA